MIPKLPNTIIAVLHRLKNVQDFNSFTEYLDQKYYEFCKTLVKEEDHVRCLRLQGAVDLLDSILTPLKNTSEIMEKRQKA